MAIWGQVKAFWRAFRASDGKGIRHRGHSLAETLEDSTHVRGGQQNMGLGIAGTEQHHQIVAEGHEHYTKSFEDDD